MSLDREKNLKLFYSIKEVASLIGISETTLRYWESEFHQIKPKKGSNGVRRYAKEDIQIIKLVYHLVKERGLTLQGAKQYLKGDIRQQNIENTHNIIERLKSIRSQLMDIKDALNSL